MKGRICVHLGVKFPCEFHPSLKMSTKQKVDTVGLPWGERAGGRPERSAHPYLVVAIFSPFFQSQNTTLWKSSKPTDTRHFPSAVWKQQKCQTSRFSSEKQRQFRHCKEGQETQQYSLGSNPSAGVSCVTSNSHSSECTPLAGELGHWPGLQPRQS